MFGVPLANRSTVGLRGETVVGPAVPAREPHLGVMPSSVAVAMTVVVAASVAVVVAVLVGVDGGGVGDGVGGGVAASGDRGGVGTSWRASQETLTLKVIGGWLDRRRARRCACRSAIQRTFGARRGRGKCRGARRRCFCLP
jgi:hypothetical protein